MSALHARAHSQEVPAVRRAGHGHHYARRAAPRCDHAHRLGQRIHRPGVPGCLPAAFHRPVDGTPRLRPQPSNLATAPSWRLCEHRSWELMIINLGAHRTSILYDPSSRSAPGDFRSERGSVRLALRLGRGPITMREQKHQITWFRSPTSSLCNCRANGICASRRMPREACRVVAVEDLS